MKKGMVGILALAGALAGCLDTAEPEERVSVWLAHVAPGAGSYEVRLDGEPLFDPALSPLQYTSLSLTREPHTYSFESTAGDTVLSTTAPDSGLVAVLLMDAVEPTARSYGMERVLTGQRVHVIHADTSPADLTVLLIDQGAEAVDTVSVTLPRGAGATLELEAGTYGLWVHRGVPAEAASLSNVIVRSEEQRFLVIYPAGSETSRYERILF